MTIAVKIVNKKWKSNFKIYRGKIVVKEIKRWCFAKAQAGENERIQNQQ